MLLVILLFLGMLIVPFYLPHKKDKTRFKSEVDDSDYYKQVKEIEIGTVDKNGKMWTGSRWL